MDFGYNLNSEVYFANFNFLHFFLHQTYKLRSCMCTIKANNLRSANHSLKNHLLEQTYKQANTFCFCL